MTIGFRADIKKPPDLVRPGGPPNQRRAISRGTSPANLDRNAALVAHAGCKARTFEALRAWVWTTKSGSTCWCGVDTPGSRPRAFATDWRRRHSFLLTKSTGQRTFCETDSTMSNTSQN